jgi:hypothetical protein
MDHEQNTILSQNIRFLWTCISMDEDEYILSPASKQNSLTMVSLRAGTISPVLCSTTLGCSNGEPSRQTVNSHCLLKCSPSPYSLGADHTENTSSCTLESLFVAAEQCLQRRCHKRPHTQHCVFYCCVCICRRRNVFSNGRLFSFHSSDFRHVMAKQNNVGYWVLAADTFKVVII